MTNLTKKQVEDLTSLIKYIAQNLKNHYSEEMCLSVTSSSEGNKAYKKFNVESNEEKEKTINQEVSLIKNDFDENLKRLTGIVAICPVKQAELLQNYCKEIGNILPELVDFVKLKLSVYAKTQNYKNLFNQYQERLMKLPKDKIKKICDLANEIIINTAREENH